jgi:hypothetical protein
LFLPIFSSFGSARSHGDDVYVVSRERWTPILIVDPVAP